MNWTMGDESNLGKYYHEKHLSRLLARIQVRATQDFKNRSDPFMFEDLSELILVGTSWTSNWDEYGKSLLLETRAIGPNDRSYLRGEGCNAPIFWQVRYDVMSEFVRNLNS